MGSRDPGGDAPGDPPPASLPPSGAPSCHPPLNPPTSPAPHPPTPTTFTSLPGGSAVGRDPGGDGRSSSAKVCQVPRPGDSFQSLVLSNFHSLISPLPLSFPVAPAHGELWITPPFSSPSFSVSLVQNLVNYFFCASPEHLVVSLVEEDVFFTKVASPGIALLVPNS
jgi:hypothetical protein